METKLPNMNNDEGIIGIYRFENNNFIKIDSFYYNEDFHFAYLDDVEGVSLEKINPFGLSEDASNWHSAASTYNYASPGIANSVSIDPNIESFETFHFQNKTFSPDGDGQEDILILNYLLDKNDYLFDVEIYDSRGIFVKSIYQNASLSSKGIITWDGVNESGLLSQIGIYIMNIKYFAPNQKPKYLKKSFVLARQL